jgi:type IV pilus assembly protein PilX
MQRGAALIIGLILLLVLTLLAVAGMNSASMEFIMAGNEQYRQNAFVAAETGIEQAFMSGEFNQGNAISSMTGNAGGGSDTWSANISTQLGGAPQPALWGNTWDSFSTIHFEIESTGTQRNALAANVQGVAVISPPDATVLPDPLAGTTKLE